MNGVPEDIDPRQHAPIAAAWLACAIALAGASRAATFCAFEAAGARGLLDGTTASPAARVFAALADAQGKPLEVLGLRASTGAAFVVGRRPGTLWLVDLSGRSRPRPSLRGAVVLDGPGRAARLPAYVVVTAPFDDDAARVAHTWVEGRR